MLDVSGHEHAQLSESLVGADPPQSELERRTDVRATLAGVAALPPLQREALMRTAVEGHSHEQVAAMLGLSDGAVRGLVYRARTTLRNAAAALTPFPFVKWTVRAGHKGAQFGAPLAGHGGGGGAAGLGALVKGGATVTASVFVVGAAVVHPRLAVHERRVQGPVSARPVSAEPAEPRDQASSAADGGALDVSYVSTAAASDRSADPRPSASATSPTSSDGGDNTTKPTSSAASDDASSPTASDGGDSITTPTSSGASGNATSPTASDVGDSTTTPTSSAASGNATSPTSSDGNSTTTPTTSVASGNATSPTSSDGGNSTTTPTTSGPSGKPPSSPTGTGSADGGSVTPSAPAETMSGD
jgi:hypothetical protein